MALNSLDLLNGTLNWIFISVSVILGILIIRKYFKNKNKDFILVGLTWILITSGWWGTSVSFLIALFLGNDGLSFEMIMLINFVPLPIGLVLWLIAYSHFTRTGLKFVILGGMGAVAFIFYYQLFYNLLTDPSKIGRKLSPVDTAGESIELSIYLLILMLIFLITGIHFAIKTLKIGTPETKIRGKILLLAFPLFILGAMLDSLFYSTEFTLILFRSILTVSSITFYTGFILPSWIKKFFLK